MIFYLYMHESDELFQRDTLRNDIIVVSKARPTGDAIA